MVNKDTCPMMPVIIKNEKIEIGVIGTEQGAGASFICRILERELKAGRCSDLAEDISGARIVDMGEYKKEQDGPAPERIIIVSDGSSYSEEKLNAALKVMKNQGKKPAVIFNKCRDDFEYSEEFLKKYEDIPCFRIPLIQTERFAELYNFIFYS